MPSGQVFVHDAAGGRQPIGKFGPDDGRQKSRGAVMCPVGDGGMVIAGASGTLTYVTADFETKLFSIDGLQGAEARTPVSIDAVVPESPLTVLCADEDGIHRVSLESGEVTRITIALSRPIGSLSLIHI